MRIALACLCLGAPACGSEGEGALICVDAAEIDQLEVTLVFAADPDGRLCQPARRRVGSGQLPYCVEVVPGLVYREMIALRADALRDGALVGRREILVPFDPGRLVEGDLSLDTSCAPCLDDEQCVEGDCRPVPWPGVFDPARTVMDPVPCVP